MTELDQRGAVHGVFWTALQSIGVRLFSLLVFIVLARLLSPSDFGLLAMAGVFVALGDALVAQGFGTAITQREALEPEHESTAFWTNMLAGIGLGGLLYAAAPSIAGLYGQQELTSVIRWLSLALPLRGAVAVPVGLLQRRFEFRALAIRSVSAALAGGVAGVLAAVWGWGVYALVVQQLVGASLDVIVVWSAAAWWPRLAFSMRHLKDLIGFSSYLLASGLLGLLSRRADDFLIGLVLGDVALGIYSVAYRGLQILEQVLAKTGTVVAFSAFSRLQGQPERMREAFYQSTRTASLIATPVFVGVSLLAPLAVPLVFGEQYAQSGQVLQVLALIGVLHGVSYFDYAVYMGVGRPDVVLKLLAVNTAANVILFFFAAPFGIVAVAAAYVVRAYVLLPLNLLALRATIAISTRRYFANFIPALGACLAMAISIWVVSWLGLGDLKRLFASIVAGSLVYLATLQRVAPALVQDLRSKLGLLFRRGASRAND
ncbi:MAG: lipopolysaccharide biosynthesis protein [Myxococcales bacterium]|nr:oligosaccharide flippase family protein [Deltaproteobacteria bacterium]NNE19170.1 lipopolysaccharide biosynthesis protein [Myxococcales bacterium]